jgi:hypothetical protein
LERQGGDETDCAENDGDRGLNRWTR